MSAMMMTHNMASRVTFNSRAGADASKLRSKVHRAPCVAGQATQRRAAVVAVQAQKVRSALTRHILCLCWFCGLISYCTVQKQTASLTAAAAALLASAVIGSASVAQAADYAPPPQQNQAQQQQKQDTRTFEGGASQAPAVKGSSSDYQLPEGNQWRYSEFINAVQAGKVERVRFSKDGSQLQLTAVDGRRALVVLPNDPDLVDILAKNGVDISVSEGEQQGNYVALLGNLLFPVIAFAGLFFLFRRSGGGQGGGGPMGGMGGPMDFGKSKSKFQEVPETGITFADVAVSSFTPCATLCSLFGSI